MNRSNVLSNSSTYLIPNEDFGNYLYSKIEEQDKTKIALVDSQTNEIVTLNQLQEKCIKLARSMKARGVEQEDVICVISENSLFSVMPVVAGLYIGATVYLLNPSYIPRELAHSFQIAEPKIIFCSENTLQNVLQTKADANLNADVIVLDKNVDGVTYFETFLKNECGNTDAFKPEKIKSREQIAIILCSSGTSGQPKGVKITYNNLITHASYMFHQDYTGLAPTSVVLLLLPGFHIFGLFFQLFGIACGAKLVLLNKFKPELFLKAVEEFRVTNLSIVPPLALFLAKNPLVDNYNLTSIEDIICGAAPLGQSVLDILEKRLQVRVRQIYGLTEVALVSAVRPSSPKKPNSVGLLAPNLQLKIRDQDTNKILGPHQQGEICVKGVAVTKGYVGNAEATKNAFDEDGFFLTGDIGYYDEDMYLYIMDRVKELIKYKGFQVAPAELESILLTHSAVREAAVIGIPDERAGELPMAFVVKQPDAVISEEELLEHVHAQVSIQKRLYGGIRFTEEIPKSSTGKILKRILKQNYIEESSRL